MATITRWRHSPEYVAQVMSRKTLLTRLIHGTGLYGAIDKVWWPNRDIEVTSRYLTAPVDRPLRLALVADLHVVRPGERERRLLELLDQARPDVIALNGDFGALGAPPDACAPVLAAMRAPLGVYATLGNWDYGHPVADWEAFLRENGVRLLRNAAVPLRDRAWLAGLDSALMGHPDLDTALAGIPPDGYTMLMIHCPVLFDDVAGRVPLVLAGHTHGGQIVIPPVNPFYMPRGCRPYVSEWYMKRGSGMYVSRGIGCPSLPVRIGCRPELALFDLIPGQTPFPS